MKVVHINEMNFLVRNDADLAVCKEIFTKNAYQKPRLGFTIKPGETWIDCGANIGAFAVWAEKCKGAKVIGFEACEENTQIANHNLQSNGCKSKVFTGFVKSKCEGKTKVGFNEKTPARSSLHHGNSSRLVQNISLNDAVEKFNPNGIKIDIEGGEFDILDNGLNFNGVDSICIEYHFRFNKDTKLARKRIEPFLSSFKNHSVPKTVFKTDIWPAWQDAIFYFWN